MKTAAIIPATLLTLSLFIPTASFSQGPLDPDSGPSPTMKSLEDLWNAISVLSNKLTETEASMTALSNRLEMTYSLLEGTFSWALQASESAASATSQVAALASSQTLITRAPVTSLVDTNGVSGGLHLSMALTSQGYPAISYNRFTLGDLMYAEWNGSEWAIRQVYTNGLTGYFSSLAMQPGTGYPAISFYDATEMDLMYAGWSGSNWVIHTVDSTGDVGLHNSLAFTADGMPAMSYYNSTIGSIKYAVWNGGGWTYHTVMTNMGSEALCDTSLAFTSEGTVPAIAFQDPPAHRIRYAIWTNATWNISEVDHITPETSGNISLSFTRGGEPAMCYYDDSGRGLVYAEHMPDHWAIQVVDGGQKVGYFSDLAFNPAGSPCISYQDANITSLKYAEWTGDIWRKQVACKSISGHFASLAFTAIGHPIISHGYGERGSGNIGIAITEITPAP